MPDNLPKFIPPLMGFFGASLMMTYLGQMPPRQWVVAISAGVMGSYFGVPIATRFMTHTFEWFPNDDGARGLIGFVIGLSAIFLVGGVAAVGRRFESNPTDLRSPK